MVRMIENNVNDNEKKKRNTAFRDAAKIQHRMKDLQPGSSEWLKLAAQFARILSQIDVGVSFHESISNGDTLEGMTREQFKDLFGLDEFDAGMEYADEEVATGSTYYECAKLSIATMNSLIFKN